MIHWGNIAIMEKQNGNYYNIVYIGVILGLCYSNHARVSKDRREGFARLRCE